MNTRLRPTCRLIALLASAGLALAADINVTATTSGISTII